MAEPEMSGPARLGHLARRAIGSISDAPPPPDQCRRAAEVLSVGELNLWNDMAGRDRRHSLEVLARFDAALPEAPRAARAAALLHDVGKSASGLGWWGRIAATVIGPRTKRFALYHRHEEIGAELLREVSEMMTVDLVCSLDFSDPIVAALRAADNV